MSFDNTADTNFRHFMGKGRQAAPYRPTQSALGFNRTTQPKRFVTAPPRNNIPRYNDWLGSNAGGQLLETLTRENDVLKGEIESLREYVKSAVVIFNKLEGDNAQLQGLLKKKDEEIQRIFESMAVNEEENGLDFKMQIGMYQEQLDVLIKHLQELTQSKEEIDIEKSQHTIEMDRAKQYNEQIKNNIEAALAREKSMINELELTKLRNTQLHQDNEELILQTDRLNQKLASVTTYMEQYKVENAQLKNNLVKQQSDDKVRINCLTAEIASLKQELATIQANTGSQQGYIKSYRSDLATLRIQCTELTSMKETQAKEIQNLTEQVKLESGRRIQSMQREQALGVALNQAEEDLKKLKMKVQTLQEELKRKQVEVDNEILTESSKHMKTIELLKQKYNTQLKDKDLIILKSDSALKEALEKNEVIGLQNTQREKEILELKQKLTDYQQQARTISEQSMQLKDKTNTINEQEAMLKDYQQQIQRYSSDNEDRIIHLEEQLRRAENEKDQLQSELEQAKWYEENQQQLSQQLKALKAERDDLKRQLDSTKRLDDTIKTKYEEAETTILSLETRNKQLHSQVQMDQTFKRKFQEVTEENELLRAELRSLDKVLKQRPQSSMSTRPTSAKRDQMEQRGSSNGKPNERLPDRNRLETDFLDEYPRHQDPSNEQRRPQPPTHEIPKFDYFSSPPAIKPSQSTPKLPQSKPQSPYLEYDYPVRRGAPTKQVVVNYR